MYNILSPNYLEFGKGMNNSNSDFRIISSNKELAAEYDVLIFTDSKGSTLNPVGWKTWTELLMDQLEKENFSYLFISRPKEITIYFTLINFLKKNSIKYKYLISNIGFVDFTPKKIEFMNDILMQNPFPRQRKNYKVVELGNYKLNSGNLVELYSFDYGDITSQIARELETRFRYSLLIGCLEFSKEIDIERERPEKFFNQLRVSNNFIFNISQASHFIHYIHPLKYQYRNFELLSYDAVHFTKEGHLMNFRLLKSFVENYILRKI